MRILRLTMTTTRWTYFIINEWNKENKMHKTENHNDSLLWMINTNVFQFSFVFVNIERNQCFAIY